MAKGRESGMPDVAYWQTFFNPDCIVPRLDCTGPGDVIEFGCGYGHFAIAAAKLVSGKVFALDIDPVMMAATTSRVTEAGLSNVIAQERDFLADGCGRPIGSAIYVMLLTFCTWKIPSNYCEKLFACFHPKANWASFTGRPTRPRHAGHPWRFARKRRNAAWAEQAGFQFLRDENLSCCSWHWGMVLTRTPALQET